MKTKTLFKYAIGLIVVMLCVFTVEPSWAASVLPRSLADIFASGNINLMDVVAPTAAAQAIDETVTTTVVKTAVPNLLRPEISNTITKVRPDVFPMDTILRKVGRLGKCDSREYKYYSSAVRGVSDIMTATYNQADVSNAEIAVTNPHIWLVDDVGFFPDVLDNSTSQSEFRFKVTKVDNAGKKLTIVAVNGCGAGGVGAGTYIPTIAISKKFTRIGNAKAEIDAQNTPYANLPTDTSNYVQIFMCQVEESLVNSTHNKEVEYNINDFQTDAIYDMRRMAELTMLFGYPKQDVFDPESQKYVDLMGGARYFITKSISYDVTTAGTNADLNSWAKQIFAGNNGSSTRILFAGNALVEWLMNIDVVQKQLAGNKSEVIAGIKFKVIETFFGDVLIRRHQAFDDVDGFTYNGLVLDIDNVERRIRQATDTTELNLNATGQRKVKAYRIDEAWTVAFRNPDTHTWIETTAVPA